MGEGNVWDTHSSATGQALNCFQLVIGGHPLAVPAAAGGPSVTPAVFCWLCSSILQGRFPCRALRAVLVSQSGIFPLRVGFSSAAPGAQCPQSWCATETSSFRKMETHLAFQASVLVPVEKKIFFPPFQNTKISGRGSIGLSLSQELIRSPEGMFVCSRCTC